MKESCDELFSTRNPCRLYILVAAASGRSGSVAEYSISASLPDGAPTEVVPNTPVRGRLIKGLRQFYFIRFDEDAAPSRNAASGKEMASVITVSPTKGDPDIYCTITTLSNARNPPADFSDLKSLRYRRDKDVEVLASMRMNTEIMRIPKTKCPTSTKPSSSASSSHSGSDEKCAIFCAIYAFRDCVYSIDVKFDEVDKDAASANPWGLSGGGSSSSSSGSSSSSSSAVGDLATTAATSSRESTVLPGQATVLLLMKGVHEIEKLKYQVDQGPSIVVTVNVFVDCHLVLQKRGDSEEHRVGRSGAANQNVVFSGLDAGTTIHFTVKQDPNFSKQFMCLGELRVTEGDSAATPAPDSGIMGNGSSSDSGDGSSSSTDVSKLFPHLKTENDSYKRARLARLSNGVPFVGSTFMGRGFEEQQFLYSPSNCDTAEVRFVCFLSNPP